MFFDPETFLERDPATAVTPVEEKRLVREAEQRAGLCESMLRVVAKRGYAETTIHEVVTAAGFGKLTYYKLFPSKEACFVAALEACAEVVFARIEAAVEDEAESTARVAAGLGALVGLLAEEPELTRVTMVEARAGGVPSREVQLRLLDRLAGLIADGAESDGEVSSTRLAIGAVSTIIALEVAAERTAELPGMLPELVDAALVSWLGTARAVGLAER